MEKNYEASSGEPALGRESDLDRDRTASMADEGGCAAAETDLHEQLALVVFPVAGSWRQVWGKRLLWGALTLGAAALLLNQFAGRWRRA